MTAAPIGLSGSMMNQLVEYISYEPETGILRWKKKNGVNSRINVGDEVGCVNVYGYIVFKFEGKQYLAHRVAWFLMTGCWPKAIDHINRERSDNRWSNLREATASQNAMNRSDWVGITWDQRLQKYEVRIQKDGRRKRIGYFEHIEAAIHARKHAERQVFAEFAPR